MSSKYLLLALVLLMGIAMMGWQMAARWTPDFNRVAIKGELDSRQRDRVLEVLLASRQRINGLDDIRALLGDLPWVHHASVMRRWPDTLVIEVAREAPIAYWNEDAFINAEGHVFQSPYIKLSNLPQLFGPAGSEAEAMRQYQSLSNALSNIGQSIDTLRLDERGSWEFETGHGIKVMLGKQDIMDRIQRFMFVAESVGLSSRMDAIDQIDTRYSNGLAVSWMEVPPGMAVANSDAYSEKSKRETKL